MNKKHILAAAAALSAALAAPAFAQQFYVGVSASSTRGEVDSARISGELVNNLGFFTAATAGDVSDNGARLFGGMKILPWLGVEAHYADLGKVVWASAVTPTGTLAASIKNKAYGVSAVVSHQPMPKLTVFGKLGVARSESKASFASSGFVDIVASGLTERRTGEVYGVGVQYDFLPNIGARLDYDMHTKLGSDRMGGKFDVQSLNLGVVARF